MVCGECVLQSVSWVKLGPFLTHCFRRSSLCLCPAMCQELLTVFKAGKVPDEKLLEGVKQMKIDDDGTTVRGQALLARGPPCAKFEELVVLKELELVMERLDSHAVETEADLKLVSSQFGAMKAPLLDLFAKSKRAAQDLLAAQKANGKKKLETKSASDDEVWAVWSGDAERLIDMPTCPPRKGFDTSVPTLLSLDPKDVEACQRLEHMCSEGNNLTTVGHCLF